MADALADTDGTRYEPLGFLDDNPARQGESYDSLPVLGRIEQARDYLGDPQIRFVNALGSPTSYPNRAIAVEIAGVPPERYATLIHSSSVVFRSATIGRGVVLFPHVTVTSHAVIGNHVLVLSNCVVNHDTKVGDFTCVASAVGIAGGVTVGQGCYLGGGASIRDGIRIGAGSMIGMGSVVLKDVEPHTIVVGNPARYLRAAPGVSK